MSRYSNPKFTITKEVDIELDADDIIECLGHGDLAEVLDAVDDENAVMEWLMSNSTPSHLFEQLAEDIEVSDLIDAACDSISAEEAIEEVAKCYSSEKLLEAVLKCCGTEATLFAAMKAKVAEAEAVAALEEKQRQEAALLAAQAVKDAADAKLYEEQAAAQDHAEALDALTNVPQDITLELVEKSPQETAAAEADPLNKLMDELGL